MDKVINILLVEDDIVDIMDAQRTLDKMGIFYKMEVAGNGEQALAFAEDPAFVKPDVVLLDLNMPKMNGFEFLQQLRSKEYWKDVKIFVITTSDEKEDRERMSSLNVSGYIVKPLKFNNPSSIDAFNLMIDLMNIKNRL